jgi:Flp pilus assembly protein TadG
MNGEFPGGRGMMANLAGLWRRFSAPLNRFAGDRKGVIAVFFALALIPMLMAGGAAIDISRAYIVKQRLGAALDAAALAVGSATGLSDADLNTLMLSYFNANYPAAEIGVAATPVLTIVDSTITITATADVDTLLLRIAQVDSITVAATTTIIRETTGLEVVLVLDNTGSMSGTKLRSLKDASETFIDILFGDETEPELLKVGIVPFTGAVNVGTDTIFRDTYTTVTPVDSEYAPDRWRGCVTARAQPYDTTDDSQLDPPLGGGKWRRYLWPEHVFRNRWSRLRSNLSNHAFFGPNKQCPVQLLPLTNAKQDILDKINDMIANGVTHINLGAVWGWRVLSPGEPYTNGVAFDNEEYNKAIVIMTDGANFISSRTGDYSGYGPLSAGSLGTTSRSAAENELDRRLSVVCTNIKATGILVYTITFQVNSTSIQNLMRGCASDSSKYFNSPSGAELESAFRAIGAELSNLRIGG